MFFRRDSSSEHSWRAWFFKYSLVEVSFGICWKSVLSKDCLVESLFPFADRLVENFSSDVFRYNFVFKYLKVFLPTFFVDIVFQIFLVF